jgi:hypothetical protein
MHLQNQERSYKTRAARACSTATTADETEK